MPKQLLDLPPELTERICAFAVTLPYGIYVDEDTGESGGLILTNDEQPGITRVNKRLRLESLHLFYRNNDFCIDLDGNDEFKQSWLDRAYDWMKRLDKRNLQYMQQIAFRGRVEFEGDTGWHALRLLARVDLEASGLSIEWKQGQPPEGGSRLARVWEEVFQEAMLRRKGARLDYDCIHGLLVAFHGISGGYQGQMFAIEDIEWGKTQIIECCRLPEAARGVSHIS
ncbi:hypothetical protein Q7P37_010127 [Cladosporium fusiforme]